MSEEKKVRGKPFAKGNSGRPVGTTIIPKKVKELNRKDMEKVISKYLKKSVLQLNEIAKNPKTKSLDLMIIKIIVEAIKRGDYTRLNFLMDRTVGKVKESIEHSNPDGSMQGTVVILPSNGREKES